MKQCGFTLIELIVSLAIFSVIGIGVIVLVSAVFKGSNEQQGLLYENDQARRVAFQLTQDVRNAIYSNTGSYPIDTASGQTLILYANNDKFADIERIRYYFSGGNLYRGVIKPSGSPTTYNPANETSQLIQRNVANGSEDIFKYYNDSYDGTTDVPLTQPVNPTSVKLIRLNLKVYNKARDLNNSYTLTASASIRNLKSNLAQ